jgi:hypothetical protein
MEKSGATTVRLTCMLWVMLPLAAKTVIGLFPACAADVALAVRVVEAPAPIGVGAKLAETPVGKVLVLKAMLPLNPFETAVDIAYVVLPEPVIVCEPGVASNEKS